MTRSFAGGPETDVVVEWCRTALRAPSAGFSQGTHVTLLHGSVLADFWELSGAGDWFAKRAPGVLEAPHVALICAQPSAYVGRYSEDDKAGHGLGETDGWPVPFWLTDAAMVVQNLLLLVEEAQAGALYFGLFRHHRRVLDLIGAPADVEPLGAVAIGWRSAADRPSGSPTRRSRRPDHEVLHLQTW